MLEVENLEKHYSVGTGLAALVSSSNKTQIRAVDGISLKLNAGEVLGIVGESGCGKSSLMRTLCGLEPPTSGSITLDGLDTQSLIKNDRRAFHKNVQMIFQDPYGSLNPQHNIGEIIKRPLIYQKLGLNSVDIQNRIHDALEMADLTPVENFIEKYPHQLSGGQRQRVCIARAMVLRPRLLIGDEPISMLDVSIKWSIIRLLKSLVKSQNLAMIYVTHDLASVGSICDRLAIMYLGQFVETGPTQSVLQSAQHPYTKALLASTPSIDPDAKRKAARILGGIPDAINIPKGCRFHPRCPDRLDICQDQTPPSHIRIGHDVQCHLPIFKDCGSSKS